MVECFLSGHALVASMMIALVSLYGPAHFFISQADMPGLAQQAMDQHHFMRRPYHRLNGLERHRRFVVGQGHVRRERAFGVLIQRSRIQVRDELPVKCAQGFVPVARGKDKIAVAAAVTEASNLVKVDGEGFRCQMSECFGGLRDQAGRKLGVIAQMEKRDMQAAGLHRPALHAACGEVLRSEGFETGGVRGIRKDGQVQAIGWNGEIEAW